MRNKPYCRHPRRQALANVLFALSFFLPLSALALFPREEARRLLADDFAALNRGTKTLTEVGERARRLAETAETPELSEVLLAGAVRLFERAREEAGATVLRRLWAKLVVKKGTTLSATEPYCVIGLSSGPDAEKYPVSYLGEVPKGGWTDEHKTRKLVLRRVEPGPAVLVGQGADQRRTSVSSPYYLGVFEVTQGQWEQVMGTRPSFWRGRDYALRPVECVSYEKIRGKGGAASGPSAIGGDTFLGLLRRRTGIAFDLPTDCQWEYACAAGLATDYNNGGACTNGKSNAAMDVVGRYRFNGGWNDAEWGRFKWTTYDKAADRECDVANGTAAVGSYLPNKWGFYDMHGNVWEWCRDLAEGHEGARVLRGGWWLDDAKECCTCVRKYGKPDSAAVMNGFRLCLPLAERIGEDAHVAEARKRLEDCRHPFRASGDAATLKLGEFGEIDFVRCPTGTVELVLQWPKVRTRTVTISRPYWITKYPLTRRQAAFFSPLDSQKGATPEERTDDYACVNRAMAEGLMGHFTRYFARILPTNTVIRLPTLAEWEHAYHAGTTDPSDPFFDLQRVHQGDAVYRAIAYDYDRQAPQREKRLNAWGIGDWCGQEKVLDTFDPTMLVKDAVRGTSDFYLVQSLPAPPYAMDPCFSYTGTNRVSLIRMPFWCRWKAASADFGEDWCPIRLVIGPKVAP